MNLYHGGTDIIKTPIIRSQSQGRDFGLGFYCTDIQNQAEKWALRQARIRKEKAVLNCYSLDMGFALQKLVFMAANNQYCFCTEKSLTYLKYIKSTNLEYYGT